MPESNRQDKTATQAAYWQAQLSSDLVTEQHLREFELWLDDRPENKIAWQEVNAFWAGLDSLTEADIADVTSSPVIAFKRPDRIRPSSRYTRPALAMAASLLLMVSLVYTQSGFYFADYTTAPGKQRNVILADGSEITMNTDTAISVDYSTQHRQITLHDGEAYFVVAADAKRPFEVQTHSGQVRALGTEFNIKTGQNDVTVTVYQHAVRVTAENGKTLESLPEGQQVAFSNDALSAATTANLQRGQAWRKQRMIFQDRPLAEVIAELNRCRSGRIIVMNNDIKTLPITGVFSTDDTNIALLTIEQSLPVTVTKITEKLVLLSAK
ncbi:FecR family protein [Methylobacter sp.]|uniref:FecR family protein n=1 Tax=Methylobacter sp. TaxID=2051955 RepID=UPI002486D534|nr:FecR family protein [Methylobacter sp.]MDI1276557.1 FecR family protein [Methylobacter sp.]MDI1357215.1 FecR family protein [Methylobacter sp.]